VWAISNYMREEIISVNSETPLVEVIQIMRDKGIGSVLVKEKGRIVGIFTERDLLNRVDFCNLGGLNFLRVKDLMSKPLKTVGYGESYINVINLMRSCNIRHMPVVKDNSIVGIVSLRDLLNQYQKHLEVSLREKERELRRNFEVVRVSEERFRTIFESSAVGIILVDKEKRIIAANPFAGKLLGMDKEELQGKLVEEIFPSEGWEGIFSQTVRHPEIRHHWETKLINKEGKCVDVDISLTVLKDKEGGVKGSVGIVRDITAHKVMERMREDFVSVVSHELRTPLTIIREGVSQILEGILGEITPQQKKFLSIIFTEIDRLNRIIDSLLDISKLEAGAVTVKRKIFDITQIVKEVVSTFTPYAIRKKLSIKTDLPRQPVEVFVDRDKILQVFSNLIGNALKFTHQGCIEIAVIDKQDNMECRISDTGEGIPEEAIPKVFDKFQQVVEISPPGEKGTGLGLAICKKIIELHRGKIWVESQLNKGSRFIFTIPKFKVEEVLYENIKRAIEIIRKQNKELLIFIVRLDDYLQMKKVKEEEVIKQILFELMKTVEKALRVDDFVTIKGEDEVVAIIQTNREEIVNVRERLKRVIKGFIFDVDKGGEMSFSYGFSNYSAHYGEEDASALLEKAEKSLVKEREQRKGKEIMVVDDDPLVISSLRRILNQLGYEKVREAYDGEEALDKIREVTPHLIILDMRMPKMNGYELIGRLKENKETKDIPLIIMSGFPIEESKLEEHTKKKAIPMIGKPFTPEQVARVVNYLL